MNPVLKKIIVASLAIATSLTVVSCSSNVENANMTIEDIANVSEASSEQEKVASVVLGFFTFSITPFEEEPDFADVSESWESHSTEGMLEQYESYYDLNDYMNYDDLTMDTKLGAHSSVIVNKTSFNSSSNKSYIVKPEYITIDGDNASINGKGIVLQVEMPPKIEPRKIVDSEIIEQDAGEDYNLHLVKINGQWKIDGNSLVPEVS